jgi:hypothetical protein
MFLSQSVPQNGAGAGKMKPYESMTVPELQERCKKYKIKTTGLRKAELIMALRSRR